MKQFIIRLFAQILGAASPAIRTDLVTFCKKYKEEAKKTPNPWDDILAEMLCWIVGVD
ncbi:unnamed protein product [marine sediment metagenome]|uniref:Uncharacterized protein n=1 Tax=marine sediment metagenome TaxID=412755 RepID=X1L9S7_9ZZZZ